MIKLLDEMKQLNIKYKTMLSYYLKCKKNTENINPRVSKASNYTFAEICKRELRSIWLSKCITVFHCFDKNWILLSPTSRDVSIVSFATVIGVLIVIASLSFSLAFSLITRIIKHYQKQYEKKV